MKYVTPINVVFVIDTDAAQYGYPDLLQHAVNIGISRRATINYVVGVADVCIGHPTLDVEEYVRGTVSKLFKNLGHRVSRKDYNTFITKVVVAVGALRRLIGPDFNNLRYLTTAKGAVYIEAKDHADERNRTECNPTKSAG